MKKDEVAKALLAERQKAYQTTFLNTVGQTVLQDLMTFCRASETTMTSDARLSAALEGRREVWLRIQNHLQLDIETLYGIQTGKVRL
jgi:hypothetical protein